MTLSITKRWWFLGILLVGLLFGLSGVPPTTVPTVQAQGAPILLSGDDADDGGHCQGTACGALYPTALSFVYNNSTTSGTRIAAIGANSSTALTGFNSFNNAGNGGPGATVDFLSTTSSPSIASADLSATGPYRMIYIASNLNTSGGLTDTQLAALNARQTDIVNFVNVLGGGLMSLTEAGSIGQYNWLPLSLTTVNVTHNPSSQPIDPTPALASIAPSVTTADLSHPCCYHTAFSGPAGFSGLNVLAFHDHNANSVYDFGTDHAVILGGAQVTIQGNISLSPATDTNFTGTSHTVTALAQDGSPLGPVVGVTVTFTVTGPNATGGTATTDTSGNASFTYTGSNVGTDNIVATFVDAAGNLQTSNTVTKSAGQT